jgi:hypothetical protein
MTARRFYPAPIDIPDSSMAGAHKQATNWNFGLRNFSPGNCLHSTNH